jgi:hypothetical protein
MNIDFLLPCKIESEDRVRNVITSVTYLLSNFPNSKVILKEVDSQSNFKYHSLNIIQNFVDTSNLYHIFEKSDEKFFHKTKILNDLFLESTNNVVYSYDVDIIVPIKSIILSYNNILENNFDVIYPFGCGVFQYAVDYSSERMHQFISNNFDIEYLKKYSHRQSSTIGWGQMMNRNVYNNAYMWNENFISWGAEDCEFYYRLNALGYNVGRIDDDIFHLEHARTFNSHYHNPKFMDNHNLWQWMRTQDKSSIIKYYESQNYVKERRKKLNVGV